jgi:glycosyltransferase involved in cell wall biosynthesis
MALRFSDFLRGDICVYDCMDELSAFKNAPTDIALLEKLLFARADVVFTGGHSLYEAKRGQHHFIHAFPSSIDTAHFQQARRTQEDPKDQSAIPRPRVGYFGVIDERLDADLLGQTATSMPDVQFVVIGPVAKIDPATLPAGPNIHWLGQKSYEDLPKYLAGWDAGWMPFAVNGATRFISPTKTPEFLAAGLPVVSTPIVDVVRTYGQRGLVQIAAADTMVDALEDAILRPYEDLGRVDAFLSRSSWDSTWRTMRGLIRPAPVARPAVAGAPDYV